jgi:hypothetical protein
LLLEAIAAIGADHAVELADNLGPIVGAVERGVVYGQQYIRGAVAICVGIDFGAISSVTRLPDHAARSIA